MQPIGVPTKRDDDSKDESSLKIHLRIFNLLLKFISLCFICKQMYAASLFLHIHIHFVLFCKIKLTLDNANKNCQKKYSDLRRLFFRPPLALFTFG